MTRRVLMFGTFDLEAGYPRARSLRQALDAHGVEVVLLRERLLPPRGSRLQTVARARRWPAAAWRIWKGGRRLKRQLVDLLEREHFDALIVPYPGHFAVPWARQVFDGPILLDLFLSLQDTVVGDRRMFTAGGVADRMLRVLDRRACRAADRVFLDTPEHAEFIAQATRLPESRFSFVPVGDPGAPEAIRPTPSLAGDESLRLLWIGSNAPLHGVETILTACAGVPGVSLSFIGGSEDERRAAHCLGPHRVPLLRSWVPEAEMRTLFDSHHLVLGIFDPGAKAARVVPFKVVHALAHGRAVVTAETPAVRTLLEPGRDCITVPPGDPTGLARALASLRETPHLLSAVGERARARYEQTFSALAIGSRLLELLEELTGSPWPRVTASPRGKACRTTAGATAP